MDINLQKELLGARKKLRKLKAESVEIDAYFQRTNEPMASMAERFDSLEISMNQTIKTFRNL